MAVSAGTPKVPSEERVFSLVLALVASPQGLTKTDLFSSVHGYRERYEIGQVDSALERQFERDKDQVRQLGIPIETIDSPTEPGNNQLTRYRISKSRMQFPSDLRFTPDELTVLRVASMAWSEGSLSDESRWATMKLSSLGWEPEIKHLGIAPRLGMSSSSADPLQRAIAETRIVRFDYRLPGRDDPLTRLVAPLRLHRAEGRRHLIGFDVDRQAMRVFLLSRISSNVVLTKTQFDVALFDLVEAEIARLLERSELLRALITTVPGSAAESRFVAGGGTDQTAHTTRTEVGTLDLHEFSEQLASYGDEVVVHEPAELRDLVVRTLQQVRDQHGDV